MARARPSPNGRPLKCRVDRHAETRIARSFAVKSARIGQSSRTVFEWLRLGRLGARIVSVMTPQEHPAPAFTGVDSGLLRSIADFVSANPALREHVGRFAQFVIVVDANTVIRDLIHRVRFPEKGKTALQELVASSVVQAWAPSWLEPEITTNLPRIALKKGLPLEALVDEWGRYRLNLLWDPRELAMPCDSRFPSGDPKDVPYLALAQNIGAVGILSSDPDITEMGGVRLTFDFVLATRSYARAVVVPTGLRLFGVLVPAVLLIAFIQMLTSVVQAVRQLPPEAKVLLTCAAILVVGHARSREWLVAQVAAFVDMASRGAAGLGELVQTARQLSEERAHEADQHLARVKAALSAAEPERQTLVVD